MSTEVETIEQRAAREAAQRLRWAVEEVRAMQTTERVLIGVEHSALGCTPEPYNTATINQTMRALNQAINDADALLISDTQARLMQELYAWRMDIFKRDEKIMAHSLRRFCERTDGALDIQAFAALARFYRRCPHVGLVQCKYDLAITRLFTVAAEQNRRVMRLSRADLGARLAELCEKWDESERAEMDLQAAQSVERAVEEINNFIAEANGVSHFEDLIARDLFNRLRIFKSDLGELFFNPLVTAAVIECNVVAGNKFSTLLEEESGQISDEAEAFIELPEIFSDTSPGALDHLAHALGEMQAGEQNVDEVTRKRLERIMRLLTIACAPEEALGADEQAEAAEGTGVESEEEVVWLTSPEVLQELSATAGNKELIESYLRQGRSAEARALELNIFLAPMSEAEEAAPLTAAQADPRRRALDLILRADDMLCFELTAQGDSLPSHLETRLAGLFGEMQTVEGNLREQMSAASGNHARKDALLYVSNHLLGARLRLQSAIVRRSASELARREAARAAAAASAAARLAAESSNNTPPPVKAQLFSFNFSHPRTRKLLVAAALIIAVAGIAAALVRRANVERPLDADVRQLNTAELPGSEMLASARLRRDTLVCIVRGTWKLLPEDVKRRELESLSNYSKDKGLASVVLFDEQGMVAGSVDQGQITVENNPAQQ
ncbi:MAG: hypothetical protein JOZ52_09210 [Acidobacteria bacterium]|nr:hypothetical protein [Acidobacteriota bacterium]